MTNQDGAFMSVKIFEECYLAGSIKRGDYFKDQNGDYIVCVLDSLDGDGDEIFGLVDKDIDPMEIFDCDNDYYKFDGNDIALANPESIYVGNLFKD